MKQLILGSMPDADGYITLDGDNFHYLARVRRLRTGSVLNAILPDGKAAKLKIESTRNNVILAKLCSITEQDNPSNAERISCPPIILFQSIPKGSHMDIIARQAAELELTEVAAFHSQYSVQKTTGAEKIRRWERIIKEARQQSGSVVDTKFKLVYTVDETLKYWEKLLEEKPGTTGILLHHEPLAKGSFHGYLSSVPEQVVIVVGPEGGFSSEEAELFVKAGFKPLKIGSTILRTETAALYGIAAVRTILLECNSGSKTRTN
jgi:16S rRNA (uracil1498-N3)-methyltransferase